MSDNQPEIHRKVFARHSLFLRPSTYNNSLSSKCIPLLDYLPSSPSDIQLPPHTFAAGESQLTEPTPHIKTQTLSPKSAEMDPPVDIDMEEEDDYFRSGDTLVPRKDREAQVLNLCKTLWPSALDYTVHKRIVGSYNETIPATITLSDDTLEIMVRLPSQWGEGEVVVIDQVAVLHYVGHSTSIRVPKVVAYDTTSDNALNSQYMIMTRIRGQDLDELIDDMSAEERKAIALEMGELYHQLREIRSPFSGRIVASDSCQVPSSLRPEETLAQIPIAVEPYGARINYHGDDWKTKLPTQGTIGDVPEELITSGGLLSDPPNLSLLEMTARPFNRRLVQQEIFRPNDQVYMPPFIQNMRNMMDVIVDEEHVENPSCEFQLVHVDLFPRNIMVDPSSTPMITGIIDWDEAVFAPSFVADVSPAWLWEEPIPEEDEDEEQETTEEEEEDQEEQVVQVINNIKDLDKEFFERSTAPAPTPELAEVKRVWEEAVGRECVESATDPYAILARRFLRMVGFWAWPYWMEALYEETLGEFNKLRDEEEAKYLAAQLAETRMEDAAEEEEEEDDDVYETSSESGDRDEEDEFDDDSAWETCSEEVDDDEDDDNEE